MTTYLQDNLNIPVTIADITGLQDALDGKAAVDHTHLISQVQGLQTALDSKFDATTAGINENIIFIGANSLDVAGLINNLIADITGVDPTDDRIPDAEENQILIGSAGASYNLVTLTSLKASLLLNNVDNTSDVDKPVSTAQQSALNLKVDTTTYTAGQTAQDEVIALNTAKTGISAEQATEIS